MTELILLERLLERCREHGLSLSFEYDAGHYVTGDGEKGQHPPGYRITVGMFGHDGLYPSAYAALVAGADCLKNALEFDYDAYADELIQEMERAGEK